MQIVYIVWRTAFPESYICKIFANMALAKKYVDKESTHTKPAQFSIEQHTIQEIV